MGLSFWLVKLVHVIILVKILVDVHQCARVVNNKNGNIKTVSKVMMDKFRNVGNMLANQIMDDIKKSHNTGISPWTTLQAKHKELEKKEMELNNIHRHLITWQN